MRWIAVVPFVLIAAVASGQTVPSSPPAIQATPAVPSCTELATALTAVVRNDARFRDWAALNRNREANRPLARPREGDARVVFMGDSITDFWQQPRFGRFFENAAHVDRGISGQTTSQMLVRFRADVVDLGPKTNDEIQGNLASMSELARASGIKVILASVMPVSAYHFNPGSGGAPQTTTRPMARIVAVNEWMRKYAADHGHEYLDYFSAMVDSTGVPREDLSEDDLHPNLKGYQVMAPLANAAIARAIKGGTDTNKSCSVASGQCPVNHA